MARGIECAAHHHDSLIPQERHHVWPLGYHGPDVDSNKITVCANAHSDIHYLLEALLKGHKVNRSEYGERVRYYANLGYREVMAYGEGLSLTAESKTE